jgi:hypothetical protein
MSFEDTENFSDDDLGMGMMTGKGNDLDSLSDSDSDASSVGGHSGYGAPPKKASLSNDDDAQSAFSADSDNQSVSSYAGSDLTPEEEEKKKKVLLYKLKRLQKRGHDVRHFTMDSSLEEIQGEVDMIKKEANMEQGVKAAKRGLMFLTSAMEWANNKYDPFDIALDGWSGEVQEEMENGEYDEVLEELYEKYYEKVNVAPEVKLMGMLAGSALQFHVSNTVVKGMMGDNGSKLLAQNPNLKSEIFNAVNKTEMGQQMQQQMGMAPQKEMSGPTDVDDILAEIENENLNSGSLDNIVNQPKDGVVTLDGW